LITGGVVAVVAAATGITGHALGSSSGTIEASRARVRLPAPASPAPPLPAGYQYRIEGLTPFITSDTGFYRVDTALALPQVPAEQWSLRIHGMTDRTVQLSFADILAMPLTERDLTLSCVSNDVGGPYVGTARWLGVPLSTLLGEAGVRRGAEQLLSRSVDGMTIGTPTEIVTDGRDALLAIAMNGQPLPIEHGFPARLIVPGLFGYASATKWVTDLELTTMDTKPYWVQRGYVPVGTAKTGSRIDLPRPFAQVRPGPVTVAGIAYAQHRGIGAVQVSIDGGAWQDAELTTQVSLDTWRQWRYLWQATPGAHQIQVRAADGRGQLQPEARTPVFPSGATGWESVVVTVTT
jgi:DMSO/TMAO reductase YedYZ molybdopterin-dependent catalytic subunit